MAAEISPNEAIEQGIVTVKGKSALLEVLCGQHQHSGRRHDERTAKLPSAWPTKNQRTTFGGTLVSGLDQSLVT